MQIDRRSLLRSSGVFAAVATLGRVEPGAAQGLSERTITLVVPFTAGTGPDTLARLVGEELRQRWNQSVVVENRAGASGNIGTAAAARAAPDGHTLLFTVNTFVMNASLFRTIPYDPQKSFIPIAEIATGGLRPHAIVVASSSGGTQAGLVAGCALATPGSNKHATMYTRARRMAAI